MKKMTKSVIAAAVLAVTSTIAMAEVTANIGVTSNYMWRGITQTGDSSAVSGGIDYAHESGFYAGTWVSNAAWTSPVSFEQDFYLGFGKEFSGVELDAGVIAYTYPNADDANFEEIYLGASYKQFSGKVSYDSDNSNAYYEGAVDFSLGNDIGMSVHAGRYQFDAEPRYTDYGITFSKDDFSLMFSDTNNNLAFGQTDNYRATVSWSKSF